ncbi:hypothetical protein W97_02914 [Coniosporium apollinis CBS 100218]|uniref:Uncharacterized protein n=1 Tax=Coniosporium apollinis (strain CBS 100218) TaxID=1168221 RepID=R7YPW5_CONA1|nr:uncharacterized protein W97_02914 [Coniosporium apollinis CBS 100218]EON63686.1 hypothetical protein W97_02914 [Coniosporium apollinis CBS 100218]
MDPNADDDAPLQSPGMPLDESDMPLANAFLEEAPLEGTLLADRPLAGLWLGDTPKPRYRSVPPLHGLFERPSMDYVAPEYIRDGRNRLLGQMMPLIRQQENREMGMREMDEKIRELKAQMEALTVPSDDISEEDAVARREAGIEERRVKTVGDVLAELEPAITQRVEREWERKREKEKKEEEALKMRSKNAEELEVLRLWMRKRLKELRKETEEETRREWVKRVEREVQAEAEENEKRKDSHRNSMGPPPLPKSTLKNPSVPAAQRQHTQAGTANTANTAHVSFGAVEETTAEEVFDSQPAPRLILRMGNPPAPQRRATGSSALDSSATASSPSGTVAALMPSQGPSPAPGPKPPSKPPSARTDPRRRTRYSTAHREEEPEIQPFTAAQEAAAAELLGPLAHRPLRYLAMGELQQFLTAYPASHAKHQEAAAEIEFQLRVRES